MSYTRVIPRDLFNEAKLLKCLGQLALIIHDGVGVPKGLSLTQDEEQGAGFVVEQDESTGALFCANLELTYHLRVIGLRAPYNNKEAFPLMFVFDEDEDRVFTDSGALSSEFKALLKHINSLYA